MSTNLKIKFSDSDFANSGTFRGFKTLKKDKQNTTKWTEVALRPNSITLSGSKLVADS